MSAELLTMGDQLERLVAGLLALAQGAQGPLTAEPVDLAALAAGALAGRRPVRTDLQPAVVAHADPALLTSLIGNLLDNAFRYNLDDDEGQVEVETQTRGTRAVLTISNTGPIVPADAVDRIQQPFQRLAGAGSGSSGLGLAIVRAIADSHEADLQVVPNPDGGLSVTVDFAAGVSRTG